MTGKTNGKGARAVTKPKILNVGGNNSKIKLPGQYVDWDVVLLDIDPAGKPDLLCDARKLASFPKLQGKFAGVYCSHNLEHYFHHEVAAVLQGFQHVLMNGGFVHIRVPDMLALMRTVVEKQLDVEDVLYTAPIGPVRVRDVIYGYAPQIEKSGKDFYAHKTGFSRSSLVNYLQECGFKHVFTTTDKLEVTALAFKGEPADSMLELFDLKGAVSSTD